jgi:hypothetical protein
MLIGHPLRWTPGPNFPFAPGDSDLQTPVAFGNIEIAGKIGKSGRTTDVRTARLNGRFFKE